jgi:hypothetical protein
LAWEESVTQKADDYAMEMPPPPESIQQRWLYVMEPLAIGWRTVIELGQHERRFRRNIVRWIMARHGACVRLPSGMVVHAWSDAKDEGVIVLMRTR